MILRFIQFSSFFILFINILDLSGKYETEEDIISPPKGKI